MAVGLCQIRIGSNSMAGTSLRNCSLPNCSAFRLCNAGFRKFDNKKFPVRNFKIFMTINAEARIACNFVLNKSDLAFESAWRVVKWLNFA